MEKYPVMLDRKPIGAVHIRRVGLYYELSCTCDPLPGICRLYAQTSLGRVLIGVCRPVGQKLMINRCISVKSSGELMGFYISRETEAEIFYPVSEGEPFLFLDRLAECRFALMGDQKGILLA